MGWRNWFTRKNNKPVYKNLTPERKLLMKEIGEKILDVLEDQIRIRGKLNVQKQYMLEQKINFLKKLKTLLENEYEIDDDLIFLNIRPAEILKKNSRFLIAKKNINTTVQQLKNYRRKLNVNIEPGQSRNQGRIREFIRMPINQPPTHENSNNPTLENEENDEEENPKPLSGGKTRKRRRS